MHRDKIFELVRVEMRKVATVSFCHLNLLVTTLNQNPLERIPSYGTYPTGIFLL